MIQITKSEFSKLSNFIKSNYGIYLKEEKQTLVMGRLHNILEQKNFKKFSEYFDYIISNKTGDAVIALIDNITTNHTFFMREANHFFYFRDEVLPYLKSTVSDKDLRVWSAGCSSGEEPYTLAMIMDEFFGKEKFMWDTAVLATDLSSAILDKARKGLYDNDKITVLPPSWKLNYLNKVETGKSAINDSIKDKVIFRKLNLMDTAFPFRKKFHVIFCRNVMIYFDLDTKRKLIDKFYNLTAEGGYLFIGHSETIERDGTKYKYVMPSVYRKE